ncbi:ATP-dependent Lon protease [Vibrio methylphosphonaticus]|uniref:ATP-dependent Lon protease n=1 Tax=Vibrio methylphosphonaticus TaxID=2946866 RepID=UPI00202A5324|nr:ATP-dependent Lon protease [Vibrio methylphosphonaticus]MCL9776443.1 ATP-dependent Lon protease [Vibrio methylphosphonaticus]
MIVSPNNISAPVVASSVNPQTEQAARDNKVREPIIPTVELARTNAERRINEEEKRRKRNAWDPAEHPEYDDDNEPRTSNDPIQRLFQLLALNTYSASQGKGYAMRFRLPQKILKAAIMEGRMAKRRTVIRYHYGHAVAPNTPSDIIAVT